MQASVAVAFGLWSTASIVVGHGLICFVACGIFPNQGSNRCLLHCQAFFTAELPWKPLLLFLTSFILGAQHSVPYQSHSNDNNALAHTS